MNTPRIGRDSEERHVDGIDHVKMGGCFAASMSCTGETAEFCNT